MIVWSEDQLDFRGNQYSLITFRDDVNKTDTFIGKAVGLIYHHRPTVVPRLVNFIRYLEENSNTKPTINQNTTVELI